MVDIRFAVPDRLCCCWACGRSDMEQPANYYAPWWIENAHIVGGPGRKLEQDNRQAVVLLCSCCHRASHGEQLAQIPAEGLSRANLAWLKAERDPYHYRPALLDEWFGQPVGKEQPPTWYLDEWRIRKTLDRFGRS